MCKLGVSVRGWPLFFVHTCLNLLYPLINISIIQAIGKASKKT